MVVHILLRLSSKSGVRISKRSVNVVHKCRRTLFSGAPKNSASQEEKSRFRRLVTNIWFRRGLRALRIGGLGIMLYQLGRTSGIHDYVRDPQKFNNSFVLGALESMNATGVEVCTGEHALNTQLLEFTAEKRTNIIKRSEDMKIVRRVGERLIQAAHEHVTNHMMRRELTRSESDHLHVKVKVDTYHYEQGIILGSEPDKKDENKRIYEVDMGGGRLVKVDRKSIYTQEDEELRESKHILEKKWTFLLYHSPNPNAFVSGMLPNHVFVASGLLDKTLCANEDELAMVLGHELAHTVLDHTGHSMNDQAMTTIASVVLVSLLDPTGIGSFLYEMFGIGVLSNYAYVLPNRRCHESEADELGLIFASKACFHPERCIKFFENLNELEKKHGANSTSAWASDHPLTTERQELVGASVKKAMAQYRNYCKHCNNKDVCAAKKSDLYVASGWFLK